MLDASVTVQRPSTRSLPKVEGLLALETSRILTKDELAEGDFIQVFFTPQEKFFVTKVENSDLQIDVIKNSLIYLKGELLIEEA